jgi:hypothetical protein
MENDKKYVKRYVVEFVLDKDDKLFINKTNEGFTAWDILAFSEWNKQDILKQMNKGVKPTRVRRKIIP